MSRVFGFGAVRFITGPEDARLAIRLSHWEAEAGSCRGQAQPGQPGDRARPGAAACPQNQASRAVFYLVWFVWARASLPGSPGRPQTHRDAPASVCPVLGWQVCVTASGQKGKSSPKKPGSRSRGRRSVQGQQQGLPEKQFTVYKGRTPMCPAKPERGNSIQGPAVRLGTVAASGLRLGTGAGP